MEDIAQGVVYGIIGPTASGKSDIGKRLASTGKCVIINADSQQIYDCLPTLSAYGNDEVGHVLYGSLKHESGALEHKSSLLEHNSGAFTGESKRFSVDTWAKMAHEAVARARADGKVAVILGGTGLYFNVLQNGIVNIPQIEDNFIKLVAKCNYSQLKEYVSEDYAARIHDERRLRKAAAIFLQTGRYIEDFYENGEHEHQLPNFKIYGLIPARETIWENIRARLDRDFEKMIAEVFEFHKAHGPKQAIDMIGYKEISQFLEQFQNHALDSPERQIGQNELRDEMFFKTRQYAKRQTTYIRNILALEAEFSSSHELLECLLEQI